MLLKQYIDPVDQHWTNVLCLRESPPVQHSKTFIQRRPNVFDVGPTLYKVIQMFCAHWVSIYKLGVNQFRHPRSNTVSLFASQRPSRGQG